jgi:hypothetical protein
MPMHNANACIKKIPLAGDRRTDDGGYGVFLLQVGLQALDTVGSDGSTEPLGVCEVRTARYSSTVVLQMYSTVL